MRATRAHRRNEIPANRPSGFSATDQSTPLPTTNWPGSAPGASAQPGRNTRKSRRPGSFAVGSANVAAVMVRLAAVDAETQWMFVFRFPFGLRHVDLTLGYAGSTRHVTIVVRETGAESS